MKPGEHAIIRTRVITPVDLDAMFISSSPAPRHEWMIHDITINNRSTFGHAGTLPGDLFDSDHVASSYVAYGRANAHDELCVILSYVGDASEGKQFYGSFFGIEADDNPITMLADVARSVIHGPSLRYSAQVVRSLLWDLGKAARGSDNPAPKLDPSAH